MRRPLITELKNPRWVYHPTKEAMAVEAEEAEELYKQGWFDNPACKGAEKKSEPEIKKGPSAAKNTEERYKEIDNMKWGLIRKLHKSVTGRDERKMKKHDLINEIIKQESEHDS